MTDTALGKTAILGMACALEYAPDLGSFWRHCLHAGMDKHPAMKLENPRRLHDLWTATIRRGINDAGILPRSDFFPDTQFMIFSADSFDVKDKAKWISDLGMASSRVKIYDADDYPGLSALTAMTEALQDDRTRYIVAAALRNVPDPECIVLVLGKKIRGRDPERAYGSILHIECFDQEQTESRMVGMPVSGIGHIIRLAGEDQRASSPDITDRKTNSDPQPEFTGLYPVCMVGCPGEKADIFSGMSEMIRSALSISNKIITPSPGSGPNPWFLKDSRFYINHEIRPWIHQTGFAPRRAAVAGPAGNGRGMCVVLEEISSEHGNKDGFLPKPVLNGMTAESEIIILAAETAPELAYEVNRLLDFLSKASHSLDDLAFTLTKRFDPQMPHRLAMICKSITELVTLLQISRDRLQADCPDFRTENLIYHTQNAAMRPGRIACLFPGLGFPGLLGPYADHLKSLILHFPEFREVFDRVERRDGHPGDPTPTSHLFFPPAVFSEESRLGLRKRLASPRIEDMGKGGSPSARNLSSFGVSVANWACWRLLQALNIIPDVLFGQSLGELSALCASGVINFDDFIPGCWQVSIENEDCLNKARLALAGADIQQLSPHLERFGDVHIAIHVAPEFQILGGEIKQLTQMLEDLRQEGIWTHFLPYPAIHTPRLTALRPVMEPHLNDLPVRTFDIPVYSGMTTGTYPEDPQAVLRLMTANIDHPVLLWQTTRKMYEDGMRVLIQVGGGATMYAQAKSNLRRDELIALSLDVDYRSALDQLNHVCAALLTNGVDVNVQHLYEHRACKEIMDMEEIPGPKDHLLAEDATDGQEMGMPLIGTILGYAQESEIIMERVIDINRDLFMRDHVFVYAGGVKPDSHCLPVVPMTVSLEMMAEAAACLAPGCGLTGFEDIRALQWIALLDCETQSVKVHARCHEIDPVTGIHRIGTAIFIADNPKPAIQGTVLLGRHYVEELFPEFTPIDAPYRYPFKEEAVYGERHLFHGPIFHCITGPTAMAGKKVIGTLRVMPRHGMFSFQENPAFLCDPVLLDGVGQLAGLWAMDQGKHVFPVGVKKIEIYSPTPEVGSTLPILLEIKEYSPKILAADVEIQDGTGRVWMRIHHWQDWVFNWPRGIYDFRRNPEQSMPSRNLSGNGIPSAAVVQYVSKSDLKDVWLDVASRFFLHPDEMNVMAQMAASEERWRYLMGRIAVKDALRRWLAGPSGRMSHPAGMLVCESKEDGFILKHPVYFGPKPYICVGTSDGAAVAAVSADPMDINIDHILDQIENPHGVNEKETKIWRLSN